MDRKTKVELTNLCLIYNEHSVLVQKKITKEDGIGLVFPGGHVEDGESLRDSVIREVKEETGLTIRHPVLCGVKDWIEEDGTRYLVLLYKTKEYEGTLTSSKEGEVFWLSKEEIPTAQFIWNMKQLLPIFASDQYSEFFFQIIAGTYEGTLLE